MKLFYISLAALFSLLSSFALMIFVKQNPPSKWGDRPYAKKRFALWINHLFNKSSLFHVRVDWFHLCGMIFSGAVFLASVTSLIIDYMTEMAVSRFLGARGILFIVVGILFIPFLYEAFLVVWWAILDRKNPRIMKLREYERLKKGESVFRSSDSPHNGTDTN